MNAFKSIILALVAVFAPIQGIIITALVLILADLILGMIAAHKRQEPITSAGIRRTVSKILVYEGAILLGHIGEVYMLDGIIPVVKIVAAIIGAVELKSILESLDDINGSSLFKDIVSKLGSTNDKK